jgi:hypothetical protein
MSEKRVKGEMHGCVVCGKLHQLYVVYDSDGRFVDLKVMSADGKRVPDSRRALVACQRHSPDEIESALARSLRNRWEDE